jgi:5-methylthioribose kinase
MRDDQELKAQVMELKYGFMTRAQALIHGDLHTGSVMVNAQDTRVIDPEFCFYGPMGFDIGALLGNYILNYAAQDVRILDPNERSKYQGYLLSLVRDTWHIFKREFETMWLQERSETMPVAFCRSFMVSLLQDTAGYAGCKIIRRIIGSAHVEDMDGIEDLEQQARAMSLGLRIGQRLILERKAMRTIEDVLSVVSSSQPVYPIARVPSWGK